VERPRTCPLPGGEALKAILVGLFALVLATQALAATRTTAAQPTQLAKSAPAAKRAYAAMSLEQRLAHKLRVARKHRGTIRFFENRRWLLTSARHRPVAAPALRRARRELTSVRRSIAAIRRVLARREARRRAEMSPRAVICDVFGRYCRQAVTVARCESRLATTARNGQYLGLFQMGSWERSVFGHGPSARAQAEAAFRYFVRTGRTWRPWTCTPWYAY
jgi:hypothetical protein